MRYKINKMLYLPKKNTIKIKNFFDKAISIIENL